jgi:hypothetical protein
MTRSEVLTGVTSLAGWERREVRVRESEIHKSEKAQSIGTLRAGAHLAPGLKCSMGPACLEFRVKQFPVLLPLDGDRGMRAPTGPV